MTPSLTLADDDNRRVIMGANIGGIYGAQLFRADDRPRYRRGFSIGCAIIAFGVACATLRYIIGDVMRRRKDQRQQHQQPRHLEDEDGMRRLSSVDVHGHQGHGAAMMRVATCDTVTTLGEDETVDDADMADDGDTDETRVATSSLSLYEKAKADGITDETAISYEDEEVATPKTDEDTSDEKRKSDVVVRESAELEILENAAAYSSMEWEIGIAR
jgi:hypothetical protein